MSTDPESRNGFGPYLQAVGPTYEDDGEIRTIRYGKISDFERALELHGENVAAFLVEPIQGEAGYVMTSLTERLAHECATELWSHLPVTSRRSGSYARNTTYCSSAMRFKLSVIVHLAICLRADHWLQGLCRTGKMLCHEHDNIRPDIVLLGKALSGGGIVSRSTR